MSHDSTTPAITAASSAGMREQDTDQAKNYASYMKNRHHPSLPE